MSRPADEFYPEVARDCVPTLQEYEMNYRYLPTNKERLAAIMGKMAYIQGERTGRVVSTKELLQDAWKRIDDISNGKRLEFPSPKQKI